MESGVLPASEFSDVSGGLEKAPISAKLTNFSDLNDFEYVPCNIPCSDYSPLEDFSDQFAGCDCKGQCQSACPCVRLSSPSTRDQTAGGQNPSPCDQVFGAQNPSPSLIECNKTCTCSPTCSNRLVQHRVQIPLQVYPTPEKGLGLRSTESINKQTFVCEYAGEVLTCDEAERRTLNQSGMNYLITVREHLAENRVILTHVDPKFKGNVGRFINHSCSPNLEMIPIRVNNTIPRLALFARRDITALEELTFDYSGGGDTKQTYCDSERKKCLCGSESCKGFLPFDSTLFSSP